MPDVRLLATVPDPLLGHGMSGSAARAMIDVKFAGSTRPAGPAADIPAVAALYQGMREADADVGQRLERAALDGGQQIDAAAAHELTEYALSRTIEGHQGAQRLTDPNERARVFGARNAYASSYAELALRDVEHMDAPDIADRLIEALDNGVVEVEKLVRCAWDAPFPITVP
jgi:hypothetical protein